MISDQQPIRGEENLPMNSTNQETTYPTDIRAVDISSTTPQVDQTPVFEHDKVEVEKKAVERRVNPSLTRLLIGGLLGGTVGAIAGALANRKTSQGLKHAAQGIDRASKTIGEGLSHAAGGVVDATKSIGEGVGYAVGGSTQDAAQGIAEGTQQVKAIATEVAQTTATQVDRTVSDVAKGVKQAKTAALDAVQTTTGRVNHAVQETSDTVKTAAAEADDSIQQAIDEAVQTEETTLIQPSADIEVTSTQPEPDVALMSEMQDNSTISADDDLDVEIINVLQEDEDSALNGFFISAETTDQEDLEEEIQDYAEEAFQDNLFADVEVSPPGV